MRGALQDGAGVDDGARAVTMMELVRTAESEAVARLDAAAHAVPRPVDVQRDNIEEPQRGQKYADSYPYEDTTVLYYWRTTYWRRIVG